MTKSTKIVAALGVAAGIGVAALPLGTFAAELIPFDYTTATSADKEVTVKLTVGEAIAIATEDDECDAGAAQVKSVKFCTQKVAGGTNAVNGFTLSVKDKDSELALVNADGSGSSTSKIAAVDGAVFSGTNTWAKAGWNLTGGALENKGITAAEQAVVRTNAAKDVQINMTYNIATQANQEIGDYSDVIVYTIKKNDAPAAGDPAITEIGFGVAGDGSIVENAGA